MKKKLYLEISLQHKEEVEKAKKYNEENDLFSDFYIIDNDYSKVYSDYTKTYN